MDFLLYDYENRGKMVNLETLILTPKPEKTIQLLHSIVAAQEVFQCDVLSCLASYLLK